MIFSKSTEVDDGKMSAQSPIGSSIIINYHAHVYFDPGNPLEMAKANQLHKWIAERFAVRLGHLGTKAGGPHPLPMFEVAFDVPLFASFVSWLMMNNQGLSILIHPNTDNEFDDHRVNPLWLGRQYALVDYELVTSLQAIGRSHLPIESNTNPSILVVAS